MPQPNKIPLAFAASGDKNAIPESTETTGLASWRDGFPAITSTPFSEGGIAPKRADFNGIFNALSLATVWQQQGGFYEYDAATDYEPGNVVEYNNELYKCITANGPSSAVKAPTDATVWSKVMTAADVAALYVPLSGGTLTGGLSFSGNPATIATTTTDSYFRIVSNNYNGGASLYLSGKDRTTDTGTFSLVAYNGVNRRVLGGNPDGTLKWDGDEVERLVQHVNDSYIRFSSGLMIILARTNISASGTTITFAYPFASTPIIVAAPAPVSETTDVYTIVTTNRTATGFTMFSNKASAHVGSYAAWHAIGRWK